MRNFTIAAAIAVGLLACAPAYAQEAASPLVCAESSRPGKTGVETLEESFAKLKADKGIQFAVTVLDDEANVLAFVQSLEKMFGKYDGADLEAGVAKIIVYRQSDTPGGVFVKFYDTSDCFVVSVAMSDQHFLNVLREAQIIAPDTGGTV
jgi:hypothetical protein